MESSLALYLKAINTYKLLKPEEELRLGQQMLEAESELDRKEARDTLINSNLKLVVSVAKSFNNGNHNISLEDLIAEGNLGLITAVDKYNYKLGYRFSTCAVPWIKQAISKAIVDKSRMIRIPAHIIQKFNQYRDAIDNLAMEGNLDPSDEDIASKMGVTVEDIQNIRQWKKNTASLETPIGDEEGNTLEDLCADQNDESPTEFTEKSFYKDFISKILTELDPRTQAIFKLRYGLGSPDDPEEYQKEHTLEEIGDLLTPRITRERVRQIVAQQTAKWKLLYGNKEII